MKPFATLDFETDPFLHGREPKPFTGTFYTPGTLQNYWGDDTPGNMADFLSEQDINCYAHNGGKFDFFFLLPYLDPDLLIINGRIAKATIGKCTLLDSLLILPLPLSAYKKDDMDYSIMERKVRNRPENKLKIINYLESDCVYLHEWITSFIDMFGKKLTLPSAAFSQLKKTDYKIKNMTETQDEKFREYYFGGRTQAFKIGKFTGDYKIYDIKSAYPFGMLSNHPYGTEFDEVDYLPEVDCYLATIKAVSRGALPFRTDKGLSFPDDDIERTYNVTGYEIRAGLDTNTLVVTDVVVCHIPVKTKNFKEYVNRFYKMKLTAEKLGDKVMRQFAKLMLNACYGKFGLNPRNFKMYKLTDIGDLPYNSEQPPSNFDDWELESDLPWNKSLWSFPDPGDTFYNVATAASITGFVRAYLWRAICASEDVLYCDTDSIFCKKFDGKMGDELGDWEIEAGLKKIWIAGKKNYCALKTVAYQDNKESDPDKRKYKKASKGSRLTPAEIIDMVENDSVITWHNDAPSFSIARGVSFVSRDIRRSTL